MLVHIICRDGVVQPVRINVRNFFVLKKKYGDRLVDVEKNEYEKLSEAC